MKKHKIKVEKIYKNVVDTKHGKKDKYTLMFKGFGFSGWGECPYQEDEIVEIEYDPETKFIGKNGTIYYNLINKNGTSIMFETILNKLENIEKLLGSRPPVKEEVKEEEIPIVQDDEKIDPKDIPF